MREDSWCIAHVLPQHECQFAGIMREAGFPVWLPMVQRRYACRHVHMVPLLECYCGFFGNEGARILARKMTDSRTKQTLSLLWDGGLLEEPNQADLIAAMKLIDAAVADNPELSLRSPLKIGQKYRVKFGPCMGKIARLLTNPKKAKDGIVMAVVELGLLGTALEYELPVDSLEDAD